MKELSYMLMDRIVPHYHTCSIQIKMKWMEFYLQVPLTILCVYNENNKIKTFVKINTIYYS